jgi:hypothetical protein
VAPSGSALIGIVAPLVLPAYFELAGGLVIAALLLLWQVRRRPIVFGALAVVAVVATVGCAIWSVREFYQGTIVSKRNFYGVLRVQEWSPDTVNHRRSLIHGTIMHGTQYMEPVFRRRPTTYYTTTSGIGLLLEVLHPTVRPLKVGVIGLGTGTLAAYGAIGDVYRFYDINPQVMRIAQQDFTYLQDSDATIQLVLGDARLSLERELAQGQSQQFDVLVIDAFSSDAIPVHLITTEALDVYLKHMKPGGVIAFHVTNRFPQPGPGRARPRFRAWPLHDPHRGPGRGFAREPQRLAAPVHAPGVARLSRAHGSRDGSRSPQGTGGFGPTTTTTCSRY